MAGTLGGVARERGLGPRGRRGGADGGGLSGSTEMGSLRGRRAGLGGGEEERDGSRGASAGRVA